MESSARLRQSFQFDHSQLSVRHDRTEGILWYYMHPEPRPCFNEQILRDIRRFQQQVTRMFNADRNNREEIRYLVLASRLPGTFSLGGDLELFVRLIKERNRERLTKYARSCIDVVYPNAVNLHLPVTTISLVQGSALGGGFEAALSSNVLVAEESAQMGLPEILFNLFPGMGAYSLLARRLDAARAERMILSGRVYTAVELYEMGLVDVLARDGQGAEAVYDYVKKQNRFRTGTVAVHKVRQRYSPVSYEELMDVALLWVDTALQLSPKDLSVMTRLVKMQQRLGSVELPAKQGTAA